MPIAIAFDSGGNAATEPWIKAANATYPCLIDRRHIVAELYDMVNVPTAVWIDEPLRARRGRSAQADAYAGRRASSRGSEFPARRISVREWTRGSGEEIFRRSQAAAAGELELQAAGVGARGSDEGRRPGVLGGGRFAG